MDRFRHKASDRLPLLRAKVGDLPDRFLVVGDPARAAAAATRLEAAEELGNNREYVVFRGTHAGRQIGIASHGVGSAGAAVCFEELCRGGVRRLIRAGTTGGLQPGIRDGHLVVATAAVRSEGFTSGLVPPAYPAVASHRVVAALLEATGRLERPTHEGVVVTADVFYAHPVLGSTIEIWQTAGCVAVEMECAALFVVAAQHGAEAGAVLTVDGSSEEEGAAGTGDMSDYDPYREVVREAVDDMVGAALDALVAA